MGRGMGLRFTHPAQLGLDGNGRGPPSCGLGNMGTRCGNGAMVSHFSVVHVELKEANEFVARLHRHHKPVVGHRFSIGCSDRDGLRGVAIVGRPVARMTDFSTTAEVTRLCTDGADNACSFLYGACARAARALGFSKIQTFILDSEDGTSLTAAGWEREGSSPGGQWKHTDGKPRRTDQPTEPKWKWSKNL